MINLGKSPTVNVSNVDIGLNGGENLDPVIPGLALQMPVPQIPGSGLRVLDIYGIEKNLH
jgi:hypothetical protein